MKKWRDETTADLLGYRLELEGRHQEFLLNYRKDGRRNFFFVLLMKFTITQKEMIDRELVHRGKEPPGAKGSTRRQEFRDHLARPTGRGGE